MLFLKAWKANKDCDHRWKMLPKLYLYDLLDDKKVMTEIAKSTSWKEWQVYVAYLLQNKNSINNSSLFAELHLAAQTKKASNSKFPSDIFIPLTI